MLLPDYVFVISCLSAGAAFGIAAAAFAFHKYGDAGKAALALGVGLLKLSLGLSDAAPVAPLPNERPGR